MSVMFWGIAHVLCKLSKDKSNVWSSEDHCKHKTTNGLLVLCDIDSFIIICRRAQVFIVSSRDLLALVCALSETKSFEDCADVLLLIKVNCTVLPVTVDSYTEDFMYLPQILGIESTRQLLVEPVNVILSLGSSNDIININQQLKSSFSMCKHAWVCQTLLETPFEKLSLD